jgi:putative adhesin
MKYARLVASMTTLSLAVGTTLHAQSTRGRADTTFVWSARIRDGGTLTIKNVVGGISVTEGRGDEVEVRADKQVRGRGDPGDITFDVQESSSGATICTVYRGESACDDGGFNNTRFSVRYTVAMPRGLRLRASTGNGELSVERAGSEVDLHTGNGGIRIGQTEGRVTAATGNGDVEVEGARGPVRASTGNGRIYVATSAGPVSATTGNGDIDVRMQSLGTTADMEFRSGSGAVRVTLPADFNGEVDASTGNGELRTDFAIRLIGRLDPQHMRGTIGTGGRTLHLSTGNGRLEIRKGS